MAKLTVQRVRGRAGQSLVELLIVVALFSAVLYCAFLLIDRGVTGYRESVDALEIRQQALLGMARLSKELRDTAISSLKVQQDGVVFASTRTADNLLEFDTVTGKTKWQKFVSYHTDAGTDTVSEERKPGALMRKEEFFPPVHEFVPDPYSSTVSGPVRTPDYFRGNPALPTRVVARNIASFIVDKSPELIDIRMTFAVSGRYDHSMELSNKIRPNR